MIEILGITLTAETVITILVAFAVDELLPFLPTKANSISHAIILGIKKSKALRGRSRGEDKLDLVLQKLEALQELQETGQKIDDAIKQVRGR